MLEKEWFSEEMTGWISLVGDLLVWQCLEILGSTVHLASCRARRLSRKRQKAAGTNAEKRTILF